MQDKTRLKINEAKQILSMMNDQWKIFRNSMKSFYGRNNIRNKTQAGTDKWVAAVAHAFTMDPLPEYYAIYGKRSEQSEVLAAAVNTLMTDAAKNKTKNSALRDVIVAKVHTRAKGRAEEVRFEDQAETDAGGSTIDQDTVDEDDEDEEEEEIDEETLEVQSMT